MDKEQKEQLIDEVLEFQQLIDEVGIRMDSMTKSFLVMGIIQEAISDINSRAARAGFFEKLNSANRVMPVPAPHCPYLEKLSYNHDAECWEAECSFLHRRCEIVGRALYDYSNCLHYRAQEVAKLL